MASALSQPRHRLLRYCVRVTFMYANESFLLNHSHLYEHFCSRNVLKMPSIFFIGAMLGLVVINYKNWSVYVTSCHDMLLLRNTKKEIVI